MGDADRVLKNYGRNAERLTKPSGTMIPIMSSAPPFRCGSAKAQWPRIEPLRLLMKRDAGFNIAAGKREQRQNDEHIAPNNDVIAITKNGRQRGGIG